MSINLIYGIIEVELWSITIGRNPQYLTKEKIYSLIYIIRKVYVILVILPPVYYWFVNNYID